MKEVLPDIDRWRAAGRRVALARVVGVDGSGPRDPGATMAVKYPPEIGPMVLSVSVAICACWSGSSQAVAQTTKHADSSACCRMLISVCSANRSPKMEPGYMAEWICSPSAIIA